MRTFIISVFIIIVSCQQKDKLDSERLFEPPTEVKTKDLKELGYNYLEEWSWYNKVNGDTSFIYQTHLDADPIFSRFVDIGNWKIQDSVGIKNFIESKGGALVSPMFTDSVATRFFVLGKSSGQFFRCSLIFNHLQIEFHYPDSQDNLRSIYRKPAADGFVVEFEMGGLDYKTK